jgi:hypothetical protein
MPRITILLILSFLFLEAYSQENMSFRYADSLTFELYQQKSWGELIRKGKEAIDNGHDYYYLRMRIGMAYYGLRNYGHAASQFSKALNFNNKDQIALEYLFYSYYFSGRYFQAWAVLSGLQDSVRERIINESRIKKNSITVETFYSNAGTELIERHPDIYFNDTEQGTQTVTRSFINNALYLSHITGERSSYFHSITNLIKDNYFHYFDGSYAADLSPQRVVQNQYYGRFNFFGPSGWVVSPSFHIITAGYSLISIGQTGNASSYKARTNGFSGGIGITKTTGYLIFTGEALYSTLNNIKSVQGALSLTVYPAGNRNIFFGGIITGASNPWSADQENRIISGLSAGFSVKNKVWFEFSGSSGNMKNYTENMGLIVYNGADFITGKYNGKVIVPFYKPGITLFAGAGVGRYSSEFLPSDGYNDTGANRLSYNNYSFTGGISWNF